MASIELRQATAADAAAIRGLTRAAYAKWVALIGREPKPMTAEFSRKVTALEERLAVTLLQRTTRKLSLTAQGRAYYNQCSEPLSHLFDAERVLTQTQKKPEGLLRISAPVILGQETFYAFLSSFLKTYPRIQADLFITNLFLDLIAENIDVAIRFGELQDSSLIVQRIGKSVRYVVAAPEYLHGRLPPCEFNIQPGRGCRAIRSACSIIMATSSPATAVRKASFTRTPATFPTCACW